MQVKGVIATPDAGMWVGPLLGATRRPSLQCVANRPIVCHVLDSLLEAGASEAALVAPLEAIDELRARISQEGPAGLPVVYVPRDDPDEALRVLGEFAGDATCVLHRANGLLGQPIAPLIDALRRDSLDALLLLDASGREEHRLRLVEPRLDPTGLIEGFAGACVVAPGALRRAAAQAADAPKDFTGLAELIAAGGGRTEMRPMRTWRQFAGDALELLELNRTVLDRLQDEAPAQDGNGNRFEGAVSLHPTARVISSVIIGPVVIGAESLIRDSYVGPHTSIAERVRIEGAELERSIVLAEASVLHVGGRLVASVVGRQARIFRHFSMPRALRLQVGDGDELALC